MKMERSTLEMTFRSGLAARKDELDKCLASISDHWGYEDAIYRFYHQSFKAYRMQKKTMEVVELLQSIVPESTLNPFFVEIIQSGTGREFTPEANAKWTHETRPIVEAFLHARFFLEMACRYSEFDPSVSVALPSGWAALMSLYQIR